MSKHPIKAEALQHPRDLSGLAIDKSARASRGRKRRGLLPRLLFLALLAGGGVAGWFWWQNQPLPVATSTVSMVFPSQAVTILNATGYVVAQRKASVASKATGRLEWLGVLEGSKVRAGELIARLENRDTQAMRDLSAANVKVAEANLGQGRAELLESELVFRRAETLLAKKLISEAEYDRAVARLAKARAALAGFEAAVAVAKANLRISDVAVDQTLIRAPFDGVVLTRNANEGDTITPFSQAVDTKGAVVTVADMDTLEVEVDVAESSYLEIKVGNPVEIQLDAIPGQRFNGIVSRMVPTIDRAKASTLVKIRFLHPDPRILPNMSARAAFLSREVTDAEQKAIAAVPKEAIVNMAGGPQVYVVDDGRVRLEKVELGASIGEQVEVRGLVAGTTVILHPPPGLRNGRAVVPEAK